MFPTAVSRSPKYRTNRKFSRTVQTALNAEPKVDFLEGGQPQDMNS